MTLRSIALLAVLLLAACSSDKPKPAPTPQASRSVTMVEPVLPAHLRELSGTLSSIQGSLPRGSEVQMALLVIDERDRPQRLLASETVLATGELMPFRLPFNPESFPPAGGALRVELHARVIQSGQLAWRLHPSWRAGWRSARSGSAASACWTSAAAPGWRRSPRPAPAPPRWWLATWIPWRWQRAGRTPN